MAQAADMSREEERRLLNELFETTDFDKSYDGHLPPLAPDPDDDDDERM